MRARFFSFRGEKVINKKGKGIETNPLLLETIGISINSWFLIYIQVDRKIEICVYVWVSMHTHIP